MFNFNYQKEDQKRKIPKVSVAKNLLQLLGDTCERDIKDFGKLPNVKEIENPTGALYYIDNGSPILGVGHLDSVMTSPPKIKKSKKGNWICECPQLDDRLGAWVLLYVLPQMGITTDILLTDDEEWGQSTAQWFTPPEGKKYNWMFEFDRHGIDVVLYQYKTDYAEKILEEEGFDVSWGSFSDIAYLDDLGILGFNFGTGYYGEHSSNCYANLSHTLYMCRQFVKFFQKYSSTHMPYDPKDSKTSYWYGNRRGGNSYYSSSSYYSNYRSGYYKDWIYDEEKESLQYNPRNNRQRVSHADYLYGSYPTVAEINDETERLIEKQKLGNRRGNYTTLFNDDKQPIKIYEGEKVTSGAWVKDPKTGIWTHSYDYNKDNSEREEVEEEENYNAYDYDETQCEICGDYYPNDQVLVLEQICICLDCCRAHSINLEEDFEKDTEDTVIDVEVERIPSSVRKHENFYDEETIAEWHEWYKNMVKEEEKKKGCLLEDLSQK